MPTSNFTAFDWVIVAIYLAGTVGVGVWVNRYIRGVGDFVVAGRALRSRLSIATMVGSELGLVTVMYSAQKGFTGGLAAFHIGLVAGAVTLLVGLSGFVVVPLRRAGVMTIPEYYERRFSRGTRILGGLLLAAGGILNMGLFLRAGAVFLTALTGLESDAAVKAVMTTLIVLVLLYTALGGMVSIVITDYIQFVILSLGLLVATVLALAEVGWGGILDAVQAVHGDAGFDPFRGDVFGWQYVVWMMFLGLVSCAIWQTAVLRACSAESVRVVRRLYTWSSIGFLIRFMVPQFIGVCALAYFFQRPDFGARFYDESGAMDAAATLQAMPLFLSAILPAGVIGLIGAGMLAAFMSTHDTYLLCWATVLEEDVVRPALKAVFGTDLSTRARLLQTRVFLALIAMFLLVWSLWFEPDQDLWDYMAITGAIYFTGAFAVLTAGIYWRRASTAGARLALASGLLVVLGLPPVQEGLLGERLGRLPSPTLRWLVDSGIAKSMDGGALLRSESVGLLTVVVAVALMALGSLLWPDRSALQQLREGGES